MPGAKWRLIAACWLHCRDRFQESFRKASIPTFYFSSWHVWFWLGGGQPRDDLLATEHVFCCEFPLYRAVLREHNAEALSAALFLAKFVVPLAGRMGMESCVILPQDTQVIKNLERKASSASSPIDEQFIEVGPQCFRVRPLSRD